MTSEGTVISSPQRRLSALGQAAGYLALYVLLDWVSYIHPLQGINITPWNPQPALAIALLLWRPGHIGLVWVGLLLAELVVRGGAGDWWAVSTASLALSWMYAAMARLLDRVLGPQPDLDTVRRLVGFMAVASAGSLLCGVVYVVSQFATLLDAPDFILGAVARYWIGDFVGLVVTLPILLLAITPAGRQRLATLARRPWNLVVIALIILLLWAVLGDGGGVYYRFFYLLFIPVVIASTVAGVLGAVLAAGVSQLGLILMVQVFPQSDLTVFELQALMAAITMTGLLVGVLVDERARTAAALGDSMRLATAGQMAAALAHELGQPLTALNNYAQACRLLVAGEQPRAEGTLDRLDDVAQRIVQDVNRASEVIRRLRDFFRTGDVQRQAVDVAMLVAQAMDAHRQRADRTGVELVATLSAPLPLVWLDPVQIGVVLRNLIDNALHAAEQAPAPRRVELRAGVSEAYLLMEVLDSGPGVEPGRLAVLFEPGVSDKPGGMGIGLTISRAIVQAHGGRLWAVPETGGHFCITLMLGEPKDSTGH